jgi:hypothetical protein
MAEMMADRRASPRYVLTLVAEVTDSLNSTVLNARLSDVSRTRSFIDTLTPLAQGSEVRVRLRRGEEIFETPANVVYVSPGLGMGLHWGTNPQPKHLAVPNHWLSRPS